MEKTSTPLIILLAVTVLFFLFNNVIHAGFHVGHNHNDVDMMEMTGEHDDDVLAEHEIYPGAVAEKIKNGEDIILLDVRTLEEYAEVHLENALLLPVEKLSKDTLEQIGLGESAKDKEIILYCRSGARSQVAYNIMDSLGYTNIKSVAGGMIHWQEDNYPYTESGSYKGVLVGVVDEEMTQEGGSKIILDRELHDFGAIPQYGGTVETTFIVKNRGTENLIIGALTTSCSCTSASISSSNIVPGSKAILTVVFDPNFQEEPLGTFKRTVFIPTNDSTTPEAEAVVSVDILEKE
jgi:rhodanese-related sulfurtransferase